MQKHIEILSGTYGWFQPSPEKVELSTELKGDAFLAWKRIQENATRRNEEFRASLTAKVAEIIKSHAKETWFKRAWPTSRDFDKALMPLNPGMVLFPQPFTLSGAIKWALSSGPKNNPEELVIKSEASPYVFYRLLDNWTIAVDEHDAFSPIQVWFDNRLTFVSEPFMSVQAKMSPLNDAVPPNTNFTSYHKHLSNGVKCVTVGRGIPEDKADFFMGGYHSKFSRYLTRFNQSENPRKVEQAAVLNPLAEALGRKAVRSLNLLAPALGELKSFGKGYIPRPENIMSKYKNVDPLKHYCDLTMREHEDRFSPREPVKVIE